MYSFTQINAKIKKLSASGDFHCACCQQDKKSEHAIKRGDDFFWVTGKRTYERIRTTYDDGFCDNNFAPYIPRGIRRAPRYRIVEAENFADLISTHKVCKKCFLKFSKFLGFGFDSVIKYETVYNAKRRFTFRSYCSLKHYICPTCRSQINPGDIYVRQGIYTTFCTDCITPIEGLIGSEYSHS